MNVRRTCALIALSTVAAAVLVASPAAASVSAVSASDAIGPAAIGPVTFSDEFNGAAGSPPDSSKWRHDIGGSGWGNNELQYYTNRTDNVAHDGAGSLVITARRN